MNSQNPVGLKGLDSLHFTVDSLSSATVSLFERMGFVKTASNTDQLLFSQGQIRFLVSAQKGGHDESYFKAHGEGVSTMSFRVDNVEESLATAIKRGARLKSDIEIAEDEFGIYKKASIFGFGDVANEFIQRPNQNFSPDLASISSPDVAHELQTRVSRIDHLTNNVPKGEMDHWVDFYKQVYGFVETRYFDIKGVKTGLQSKVVQLADNSVIIPINEPEAKDGKSQIQEYLDLHKGAGVQHIALMTPDIVSTISELRSRDLEFLKVPSTYYEDIPNRPFDVTEDLGILENNQILVDGDKEGYLLQIFSQTCIGPLFFEYIQRKKHWGFGEGNFQALFDAIERDQIQRGYL